MFLKVVNETKTGLNVEFVNLESNRRLSLEHVVEQIEKGNSNYSNYQVVVMENGQKYVRSKADASSKNNIE